MLILAAFLFVLVAGMLLAWPLFHVNLLKDMKLMSDINNPGIIGFLKFLQTFQSIGLFILPPLLAGFFFEKNPVRYLGMKTLPGSQVFILTFIFLFVSLPLINWMISVNEMMKLPEFLGGVEQWMKDAEEQAAGLTEAFLKADSFTVFLINLFMIAVIPAIGEELLFRGVLQRILGEWFRNIHLAIFVSAFIFGAIHMQFYGFIPRMMLGVLFGYLFYWSGSIWLPVFGHFVNNASAVVASYLAQTGIISTKYEELGATDNIFLILISTLFSGVILYLIYLRSVKDQKNTIG